MYIEDITHILQFFSSFWKGIVIHLADSLQRCLKPTCVSLWKHRSLGSLQHDLLRQQIREHVLLSYLRAFFMFHMKRPLRRVREWGKDRSELLCWGRLVWSADDNEVLIRLWQRCGLNGVCVCVCVVGGSFH